MMQATLSNHIGGSSELLVLADIKPGFVPVRTPVTYAARLRRHLRLLDALRRNGLESDTAGTYVGPIDTLRTLQFIQWTMIDNDTRMLLSVNFDRPFEPYIRRIVDVSGALLDTIFCHCVGFEGRSSDQGFHRFMEFINANQAPVELFAAAAPDLSVDDGDYYLEMASKMEDAPYDNIQKWLTEQTFTKPPQKLAAAAQAYPNDLLHQGFGILWSLYQNASLFPNAVEGDEEIRDDILYYNLVNTLMPGFWRLLILRAQMLSGADPQELGQLAMTGQLPKLLQRIREQLNPQNDPLLAHLLDARAEPLKWFSQLPPPRQSAQPQMPRPHAPVQDSLLKPRGPVSHGGMLLLRVDDAPAGRRFLADMADRLWAEKPTGLGMNLSITREGLQAIGLSDDDLAHWPRAFREGMAERAGLLGDTGINHPSNWKWPVLAWPLDADPRPVPPWTIDIIVQFTLEAEPVPGDHAFTPENPLYPHISAFADDLPEGVRLLGVEPMVRRYDENKKHVMGHLGFADGVSQPAYDDSTQYTAEPEFPGMPGRPEIGALGDILIGHKSKLDGDGPYAVPDLPLRDGTFQVIRKTRINVAKFHGFKHSAKVDGQPLDPESDLAQGITAKMIGRNTDGSPLFDGPEDGQNFNFVDDPKGHATPLQSHIRRCNPREFDSPRILRRGFSYGPFSDDPDADRGMMFICYNASLAEQFETVQRWVSGGNSTGIPSAQGDPILGPLRPGTKRRFQYVQEGQHVSVDLGDDPVCTLQWGLYAFTPSQQGMRHLASGAPLAQEPLNVSNRITRLTQADPNAPLADWQMLLEDSDEDRRAERNAVWADIRAQGGVLDTSYGVLVGGADAARQVLMNSDDAFSTAEFHDRMQASVGPQFLGFDRTQAYVDQGFDHEKEMQAIAGHLNAGEAGADAFAFALERSAALIAAIAEESDPRSLLPGQTPVSDGRVVRLDRLMLDLIGEICRDQFGIGPAEGLVFGGGEVMADGQAHCPGDVISAAAYIFGPHPGPVQTGIGQTAGQRLLAALTARVEAGDAATPGTLLAHLQALSATDPYWSTDKIAANLAGVAMGIAAPAAGSFASVLFDWIDTKALWRIQQQFQESGACGPEALRGFAIQHLLPQVMASMGKRAAPDLTHRSTVKPVTLGGKEIPAGKRVIVSLGSAATEAPDQRGFFLFGGTCGATSPAPAAHHGCPGRDRGLNTILGCITAVLQSGVIEPLGPLSVKVK